MKKFIILAYLFFAASAFAGDNLAGTPSIVSTVSAEQDLGYLNSRSVTFDRLQPQLSSMAIPMYGDSITEAMDGSQIGPHVVLMGINGSTMRDWFGRVNRSLVAGPAISRNSQADVWAMGVNDTEYEYYTGSPQNPPYLIDLAAAWMTGKWVIVKILPINETMFWAQSGCPMCTALTNARIDAVNTHTQTVFAGRSGFAIVDAKSVLAPSGQLLPAYTIDGLHLSAAGYAQLYPLIQAALVSLGVTP